MIAKQAQALNNKSTISNQQKHQNITHNEPGILTNLSYDFDQKNNPLGNSTNGTGELNYNQTNQSQGQAMQGKGPQLVFDKNYLCMKAKVGDVEQDKVVVTNVGSTTVTYAWKKVQRGDYIQSKNSDGVQRFYCHYPRSILKPGESKTFFFSFRSATKPGIFFEEWELLTEPLLISPLPLINLSGMAIKQDPFTERRAQILQARNDTVKSQLISEILNQDILSKIESPQPPPPNLRDPEVFKTFFEEKNRHLGLYFTQSIMNQLYELLEDIQNRINDGQDYLTQWDGRIEWLEQLIQQVPNNYSKASLLERYIRLQAQARKVPNDRAHSYPVLRKMLLDLSEQTIELEQKAREELQMIENFGFLVPHDGQTEEEAKKIRDEKKAKKDDWLKKNKKKPKTEEEENQELEEVKLRAINGLKNDLLGSKVPRAENEIEFMKTKWLFDNHLKMDENQYDELYRLESILDIDISGKDIILRLDLDVPLSTYVPPQPVTQQNTLEDLNKSANTKGGANKRVTQQQHQQEALIHSQQNQSLHEDPWKKRDILDHSLIKKAVVDIRYCLEHFVNRTFILGNLGERHGKIKNENSLKIVYNVLQQQMMEQQMIFLPDSVIKDFEHRMANDEFPESTTFVLENLNFKPDEFGYVEPDKPPEEPKPTEEELKKEEELKQQQLAAQQKGGAGGKQPAAAKLSAADKKKQEEEAKKKAEEEAALKKKQDLLNAQNAMSEEERLEQQRKKEEAERIKRELEYFDYKTIYKYKESLGQYGDIYVNDAPLMTLTNCNSISEIKCRKKVMGVRMTEELRKLCLFFLKKNPHIVRNNWYVPPPVMAYHTNFLTAAIGGTFKTSTEILDKILLANALLDTTKIIYFYGEIAIAGLYAFGIKIGKLDKQTDYIKDFELTKDFFLQLFRKAITKNISINFPADFILSPKIEFEDSVRGNGGLPDQSHNHGNTQQLSGTQHQQNKTGAADKTKQSLGMSQSQEDLGTRKSQGGDVGQTAAKYYHWADKCIDREMSQEVNLTEFIAERYNKLVHKVYEEECNAGRAVDLYNNMDPTYNQNFSSAVMTGAGPQTYEANPDHYVLEYGEQTRNTFVNTLESTFKFFWDGSLSIIKDAILASEFNKLATAKLLDFRQRTNNDDEPPVTLLHGGETETVIRHSLMRLKVDQQEALEAQRRKAAEDGEELEEEEDQITMTNEESREEASTFQQDMTQIADFLCFDIPQFTTKVLQGVPNKSLFNLNQHAKKTKELEEEDLFLLDEI